MTELQRIEELERQVKRIQKCLLDSGKASSTQTARVDDTSNKVEQITPYKASKTAYYGETLKTFYDVPQGNVAIYFDNFNGDYTFEREEDRLYITFKEPLTEQTNITISIQ